MAGQGLDSLFPMNDLAVMGLAEVLPRLPRLLARIRETVAYAEAHPPDAIVTIDAPSFGLRVTEKLRGLGSPRIHYVAPQLWAWRPGRAKRLPRKTDALLALLPFEPAFFRGYGIECRFVGHPAVERVAAVREDREAARARLGVEPNRTVLAMLPGSRHGEIARLLPVFRTVVERLEAGSFGDLVVLVPTVDNVADEVRRQLAGWPVRHRIVEGANERLVSFRAADAALAASGTVSLELALSGTPMVVAYKANALTAALVRRLIKVDHVAMPNILAGGPVVPECIQERCRPEVIVNELGSLLNDADVRARQRDGLSQIAEMLGSAGERPSLRAAKAVLEITEDHSRQHRGLLA